MSPWTRYLVLPACGPVAFCTVASLPVETLGCAGRGLAACGVALGSSIVALVLALRACRSGLRGTREGLPLIGAAAVLTLPALAMLYLA